MKHFPYQKSASSCSKPVSQLNSYQNNSKGVKPINSTKSSLRLSSSKQSQSSNVNSPQEKGDVNDLKDKSDSKPIRNRRSVEKEIEPKHASLTHSEHHKPNCKGESPAKGNKPIGQGSNRTASLSSQKPKKKLSFEDNPQSKPSSCFQRNLKANCCHNDNLSKPMTSNTTDSCNANDKKEIVIHQDDDIDTLTKIKTELEAMIKEKLERQKERISPLAHSSENLPLKPLESKEEHIIKKNDEAEGCNFISIDKIAFLPLKTEGNNQSNDDLKKYFRNNKNQRVYEDVVPETYESNITENRNCYNTNNDSIRDINKELNKLINANESKLKDNGTNLPQGFNQLLKSNRIAQDAVIEGNAQMKLTGKFNEVLYLQKREDMKEGIVLEEKKPTQHFNTFLIEDNTKKEAEEQKRNPSRVIKEREVNQMDKAAFSCTDESSNINTFGNSKKPEPKPNEEAKTNVILQKIQQLTIQSNESAKKENPSNPLNDKLNQLLNQKKIDPNAKGKVKEELLSFISEANQPKVPTSMQQTNKSFLKSLFQLQSDLINFQQNSLNNKHNTNDNSHSIGKSISRSSDIQLQPQSPITDMFLQRLNNQRLTKSKPTPQNDSFFAKLSRNHEELSPSKTNLAYLGSGSNKKSTDAPSDFYLNKVKDDRQRQFKTRSSSISPQKEQLMYRIITKSEIDSNPHSNQGGDALCSLMPPNDVDKSQNYVKNFFQKNKSMF